MSKRKPKFSLVAENVDSPLAPQRLRLIIVFPLLREAKEGEASKFLEAGAGVGAAAVLAHLEIHKSFVRIHHS